jgi:Domain of unknown function (DUF1772)
MKSPSSTTVAQQWRTIYIKGAKTMPFISLIPTILFGYLAWRERDTTGSAMPLYVAAAVASPMIAPWTLLVMKDVNAELTRRATSTAEGGAAGAAQESTHELLEKWAWLNLVRAGISGISAVLGAWAALGAIDVVAVESIEIITGANRLG